MEQLDKEAARTLALFNDWVAANGIEMCQQIVAKAILMNVITAVVLVLISLGCGRLSWKLHKAMPEQSLLDQQDLGMVAFLCFVIGAITALVAIFQAASALLIWLYPQAYLLEFFLNR